MLSYDYFGYTSRFPAVGIPFFGFSSAIPPHYLLYRYPLLLLGRQSYSHTRHRRHPVSLPPYVRSGEGKKSERAASVVAMAEPLKSTETKALELAQEAVMVKSVPVAAGTPIVKGYDFNTGRDLDGIMAAAMTTGFQVLWGISGCISFFGTSRDACVFAARVLRVCNCYRPLICCCCRLSNGGRRLHAFARARTAVEGAVVFSRTRVPRKCSRLFRTSRASKLLRSWKNHGSTIPFCVPLRYHHQNALCMPALVCRAIRG